VTAHAVPDTILTDDELAEIEAWLARQTEMTLNGVEPVSHVLLERETIDRLLATIRMQRAGLEFYGDPANHRHTHDWHGQMIVEPSAVDEDGGKRARAILYPEARGGHPCLSAQRAAPR
jgi:hypothetical protein